ncbi:MAG TPA: glycine--tRNA ligase subunit beta [Holophaga sp.]|nr:glycine--tRNA ligase subunit beta [Holophaga sp.]HPS68947.1 glycine--tRNA ligase subunit beta [Holophaga sp.]
MSETKTLLLELHCEEIPARFLKPLVADFEKAFLDFAGQNQVLPGGGRLSSSYSPRKLAWKVEGLLAAQPDQVETQVGPPQRMCLDDKGEPTQTGRKFAEKWGIDFAAIRFEQPAGKKEPCAVVTLTKQGRPTLDLLAEALPRLVSGLHVPKAMRWGTSEFTFVRPIRNILCLFGADVVPFELDGVKASSSTWGHRLHHMKHPEPVAIPAIDAYEPELEKAGILVSFDRRRAAIAAQMKALAAEVGGRVVEDEALLDTLAEIVEYPSVVRGQFPAEFMALPKEVLVTSLKEHQKSFCIEDERGELLPYFLAAANRPDDPEGFIKSGNEWVLKARLYDARFFFEEDLRTPLMDRLDSLSHLTFHRELGSYAEKTARIAAIASELAGRLGLDAEQALSAARASKCDLRTLMVGEFPELQGIMGGEYLRREHAPDPVWKAVKEQYQPIAAEAPIPGTDLGGVLALADKLDTLVGCFAIGQIPSGSKDPLALRRAGAGIVRILWEKGWSAVGPLELCRMALKPLGERASRPESDTLEALESFFRDRVSYQLEVAGYAGAVRRSALPVGWADLADLRGRCEALSAFAEDARFASLGQSAKRIANILKDEVPSDDLDAAKLQEAEEKVLAEHLSRLEASTDHAALLAGLAELSGPLEDFFTAVMVKCEDPSLRGARLSLLHRLRRTFLRVADFSAWQ